MRLFFITSDKNTAKGYLKVCDDTEAIEQGEAQQLPSIVVFA
jgi:hypothetical protein